MSLQEIHDFELSLVSCCIAMTRRGILIDEDLRRDRIAKLQASIEPLQNDVRAVVLPLLYDGMPKEKLFKTTWTCPCCRNGKAKRASCWSCLGLPSKPSKKTWNTYLQDNPTAPKDSPGPCAVCGGEGRRESWDFNLASNDQKHVVLFHLLKLPKRTKVDEETLKGLLAFDKSGVIQRILEVTKCETMISIYERIAPAPDGRVHTFYNPAGTETGRFNSSGGDPYPEKHKSFALIKSTALQNIPKKEAQGNELYQVRDCFVAPPGHKLIEADLSGAEAWVTAACCGDQDLLDRLRTSGFDIHKWTASQIYRKDVADVTKQERVIGKMARHALNYGMGWSTFQANVNTEADSTGVSLKAHEAKRIREAYHVLHPKLRLWHDMIHQTLMQTRQISNCFGRVRTFFGRHTKELDDIHRQAIAQEPQSTVADLLNMGMLNWWKNYDGKFGRLIMQIHDAVVIEVPDHHVKITVAVIRKCLEIPITINDIQLTIPADVTVGRDWGHMENI